MVLSLFFREEKGVNWEFLMQTYMETKGNGLEDNSNKMLPVEKAMRGLRVKINDHLAFKNISVFRH